MSTSSPNFGIRHLPDPGYEAAPEWKQELNERLAATRLRRTVKQPEQGTVSPHDRVKTKSESRAAVLAARVAQRYANAPSYSEVLAAEAQRVAAAGGAAISPRRTAVSGVAVAAVSGMASRACAQGFDGNPAERDREPAITSHRDTAGGTLPPGDSARMLDSRIGKPEEAASESIQDRGSETDTGSPFDPLAESLIAPVQPLQANLIEFPRELVAARKARPRLAEGPLRDSVEESAHDHSQLRIFEVETESISTTVDIEQPAAEWPAIRLDDEPASKSRAQERSALLESPLRTAPLEDRLMAAIVDVALVIGAFALFVLVFAASTAHPPTGRPAALGAAVVLATFFLLYQYIFFRYSDGTPGMRYAKIALCTFDDENPTREAMLKRILSLVLSAAPLGLGFVWAWFDTDRLCWHDRMTRIYQRSYY